MTDEDTLFSLPTTLSDTELEDLRSKFADLNKTRETALGVQKIIEDSLDKSFDKEI